MNAMTATPQQHFDFDNNSNAMPLLPRIDEDLKERMEVMFWQEAMHYRTCDYLGSDSNMAANTGDRDGVMSEQWRSRMCEWAYQLVDHFDLPRSVVGRCMNYLDRYLDKHFRATAMTGGAPTIMKKQFQIVTMTCLYVALKTGCQAKVPIDYMVQLSRGTVSAQELKLMEMDLLVQLSWLVNPPTSFDFFQYYLELIQPNARNSGSDTTTDSDEVATKSPRWTAVEDLGVFLVELAVLDYYFVGHRSSSVAMAALLYAMDEDPQLKYQRQQQGNAIGDGCYLNNHGMDAFILPGEQHNVHLCRLRLASLYHNTGGMPEADDADGNPASKKEDRTASPVSVGAMNQQSFF